MTREELIELRWRLNNYIKYRELEYEAPNHKLGILILKGELENIDNDIAELESR